MSVIQLALEGGMNFGRWCLTLDGSEVDTEEGSKRDAALVRDDHDERKRESQCERGKT